MSNRSQCALQRYSIDAYVVTRDSKNKIHPMQVDVLRSFATERFNGVSMHAGSTPHVENHLSLHVKVFQCSNTIRHLQH